MKSHNYLGPFDRSVSHEQGMRSYPLYPHYTCILVIYVLYIMLYNQAISSLFNLMYFISIINYNRHPKFATGSHPMAAPKGHCRGHHIAQHRRRARLQPGVAQALVCRGALRRVASGTDEKTKVVVPSTVKV